MDAIEKQKLPIRIHIKKYIEKKILTGELKPGERIVETKVAKELNVSQTPVREALRELTIMGLLEKIPYSGTQVKLLTKKDLQDTYNVRMYLEMLAVEEALKHITSKDRMALKNFLDKMIHYAQGGNLEKFIEYDIKFHEKIISISQNALLKTMWNQVYLSQWTFVTTKLINKDLLELATRHELLYKSIEKNDPQKAVETIRLHIKELADEIINNLDDTVYGSE